MAEESDFNAAVGPAPRRYDDAFVSIRSDFECGNGAHPHPEPGGYSIDVEAEPGDHRYTGMAYYFCFAVTVKNTAVLPLRLHVRGNANAAFGADQKHVVIRHRGQWSELGPQSVRPAPGLTDVLQIDLPHIEGLDPAAPIYISNFHWHPYHELVEYLGGLRHPDLCIRTIAHSAAGRAVYRVDIGPPDAPTIVMAATPQASEMGTWTCRAIIDWLLSDAPAARDARHRHRFILLPMTNPDGAAHGLGVSHPSGRFPYFEGQRTADNDNPLPEMQACWRILCDQRPWLFIEWHSNNWDRRPGHVLLRFRPELSKDARTRARWQAFDHRLLQLPDTHHGNWTAWDEGMYQETLCFQAITRLGCIAHMIKHHDKYSIAQCARHAVDCVLAAVEAYEQPTAADH